MIYRLFLSLIFAFLYGCFVHYPLSAQTIIVNEQSAKITEEEQRPIPPLGPACSGQGGGLQIDPDNPTCCVSGYVYLNGVPTRDASVTVTAPNGEQQIVNTPVISLIYQLAVNLELVDITVGDTINIIVDSYTVIEQEGDEYSYKGKGGSPIDTFNKEISDLDEELIYDIDSLELGDLDVHTNETVTIVTTYTVQSDSEQQTLQDTTTIQIPDPSFNMILHETPLNVKPGDRVTMTVKLGDAEETEVFTARSGSIQVDVVMPNTRVNSSWVSNYLSAREGHAVAYDVANEQMVLFGGRDATDSVLNDTWVRENANDAQWIQIPTAISPPSRSNHTLLYHDRYEVVLLFGGQNAEGNNLNDLWVWNGTQWSELFLAGSVPSPRSHYSMSYDAKRREVVLFGGKSDVETLSETWTLSGKVLEQAFWSERRPEQAPPKRYNHALAYDNVADTVILFGGRSETETAELLNDTWLWDGNNWEQQTSGPIARENHSLVSIAGEQATYLFGGNSGSMEGLNDLWQWNGSSWNQVATTETNWPPRRSSHAAAYDQKQEQLFIIGGKQSNQPADNLADAWLFTPSTSAWQADNSRPDFIDWQGAAMAHEQDMQFLLFGGLAEATQASTYRWHANGWELVNPQHSPPARYHHALANGNTPEILLFGGIDGAGNYLNDTWLWNGQDWLQQNSSQGPTPRTHYALAHDKERNQWLLFGGVDQAGNTLGDLWIYTGTAWEQQILTGGPSARKGSTLVYDASQKVLFLFGGQDGDQYFNDLWAWNGAAWERQTASGDMPEPRANHGAAYYDGREKLMIISGGQDANGERNDTWAWDGSMWHEHYTNPKLPLNILSSLSYHRISAQVDQLVGLGTQSGETSLGNMLLTYELDDKPISTISYIEPQDLHQHEVIDIGGRGSTTDDSKKIIAHRWMYNDKVISREKSFTITAKGFSPGTQIIRYAVQDNEGNWSEEQIENIFVRESDQIPTLSNQIYLPTVMR